jgi:broad specificity phosphatase PhoE
MIRHSMSEPAPGKASSDWPLSEAGRALCAPLAERLVAYDIDAVVTSRTARARETGQLVAARLKAPLATAEGLHEHERDNEGWLGNQATFEARMSHFFAEPERLVFGQETAEGALRRFSAAVAAVVAELREQNVAIVSHGTVMSLFLGPLAGMPPFLLWQRLGMPAFAVLRLPGYELETVVERVESGPAEGAT